MCIPEWVAAIAVSGVEPLRYSASLLFGYTPCQETLAGTRYFGQTKLFVQFFGFIRLATPEYPTANLYSRLPFPVTCLAFLYQFCGVHHIRLGTRLASLVGWLADRRCIFTDIPSAS